MTIDEFNTRLNADDCVRPVLIVHNDGYIRHAPPFGELRGGGDRYIIHHVDANHVYHCRREGGPYSKWFEFQGEDDALWQELQEEVLIEY